MVGVLGALSGWGFEFKRYVIENKFDMPDANSA
jgi:hypothetical protein